MAFVAGDHARARTAARKLSTPNPPDAILLARVGSLEAADALIRRQPEANGVSYHPELQDALWDVARAEVLIGRQRAADAEPLLTASMARLERAYGSHVEYFLAAEQLAAIAAASGRSAEARTVLERAVARRGRVFAAGLSFWTLCARRLEQLCREAGNERATMLRYDLERILAAADVGARAFLARPDAD